MTKTLNFMRSMRFGIILLLLIAACSIVGSVIPQGREMAWYVDSYPKTHMLIFTLRLNEIFTNWYFVLTMTLLGINLSLCSIVRIKSVVKSCRELIPTAQKRPNSDSLNAEESEYLDKFLQSRGCKKTCSGSSRVYSKNLFGCYGSFITHLSILLTLIFGAAGLYLPEVKDMNCLPGEAIDLPDGTQIAVHSFYIENESGQLDFTSDISVTLGKTGTHREGSIRVNHPLSHGPYKIYQQTFGTAGKISVTNLENNGTDTFTLTDHAFLSMDGVDGLWYVGLYSDYITDPEGNILPVNGGYGRYKNPVYALQLSQSGVNTPLLALPGESIELGTLNFVLEPPVEYPGLRIKYTPPIVNTLLFAAFGLMIIGLFITFFMQPVLVKLDDEGYVVCGSKSEGMQLDIAAALSDYKEGIDK